MITKLVLHNFQAHELTELQLVNGINTLIGISDSGKSSLIRGLKSNLQRGPFYIRNETLDGFVEVVFDDYVLKRETEFSKVKKCPSCKADVTTPICLCGEVITPSVTKDFYMINDTTKMEKFGVTLPDSITSKTRIKPIMFIDFAENLNIHEQHDDHFFVGKSYAGMTRNKILSALVPDSNKVDMAIKTLASNVLSSNAEIKVHEERRCQMKKVIADGQEDADKLRICLESVDKLDSECKRIQSRLESLKALSVKLKELEKNLSLEPKIIKIKPFLVKMNNLFGRCRTTSALIEEYKTIKPKLIKLPDVPKQTFEFKKPIDHAQAIENQISDLQYLKSKLKSNPIIKIQSFVWKEPLRVITETYLIIDKLKSLNTRMDILKETMTNIQLDLNDKAHQTSKLKAEFKNCNVCPIINEEFCDRCTEILSK